MSFFLRTRCNMLSGERFLRTRSGYTSRIEYRTMNNSSFIIWKIHNFEITSLARVWYATGSYVIRMHNPGSIIRLRGDARIQPPMHVCSLVPGSTQPAPCNMQSELKSRIFIVWPSTRMSKRKYSVSPGEGMQLWKLAVASEKIHSRIVGSMLQQRVTMLTTCVH